MEEIMMNMVILGQ